MMKELRLQAAEIPQGVTLQRRKQENRLKKARRESEYQPMYFRPAPAPALLPLRHPSQASASDQKGTMVTNRKSITDLINAQDEIAKLLLFTGLMMIAITGKECHHLSFKF